MNKTIKNHAVVAGKILNISCVTITVYPNSSRAILETGTNGYTPSGDWIQIYIDSKSKKYSPAVKLVFAAGVFGRIK